MLDPFYIHLRNNSDISIISLSLNNQHYHSWSHSVKVVIRSKNKLGFLLIHPASSDRTTLTPDRCNMMVMAWITNSIELVITESVMWMETVHEICQELQHHYHKGGIFRVSDLQEEIFTLRKGHSSITQFFTTLKKLWQELENFRPIHWCLCTIKCSCTLLPAIKQYRENDFSRLFFPICPKAENKFPLYPTLNFFPNLPPFSYYARPSIGRGYEGPFRLV